VDESSDPSDERPDERRVRSHRRGWIAVATVALILVGSGFFVASRPNGGCSDAERSALLSIPPFMGVQAPVGEFRSDDGSIADGCVMEFEIDATPKEVAQHYARRLHDAGWFGFEPFAHINTDPDRFLVQMFDAGRNDPAWEAFRYYVTATALRRGHVKVEVAVVHFPGHVF
jgi:hypothetical protein